LENKWNLINMNKIGIVVVIFLFIFQAPIVFAYHHDTHAFLTKLAVEIYNNSFDFKIPEDLKSYVIEGSVREDDIPRWLNHFYDPVYNRGLTYDSKIDPLNIGKWQASKNWVNDRKNQTSFLYRGNTALASILSVFQKEKIKDVYLNTDFTWERAKELYLEGKKEEAMFVLGHVLHLIQDAAVPEHTRNDPHLDGSPYEKYTSQYNLSFPDNLLAQKIKTIRPVILNNLDSYFDGMAVYSNNNFYSKDTIGIQSGYNAPEPDLVSSFVSGSSTYTYITRRDGEGNEYYLVRAYLPFTFLGVKNLSFTINDNKILSSYWNLLSPKALSYSAGVIDLFFREVAKLKKENSNLISASLYEKLNLNQEMPQGDNDTIKSESNVKNSKNLKPPIVFINEQVIKKGSSIILLGEGFSYQSKVVIYIISPSKREIKLEVYADNEGKIKKVYSEFEKEVGLYTYYAVDSLTNLTSNKVFFSVLENINVSNLTTSSINFLTSTEAKPKESNQNVNVLDNQNLTNKKEVEFCKFDESLVPQRNKVILNEIAWMGGSENYGLSASDEWIELKNLTAYTLDISNFQLLSKRGDIKIIFDENSKISPYGFYLLERTDDNSVPQIKADLIYKGGLANSDDGLALFDKNCNLMDIVLANPNWEAGDVILKRTMERDDNFNWYTSGSFNGKIFGTPKAPNGPRYNQSNVVYLGGGSSSINNNSQATNNSTTTNSIDFSKITITEIMYDYPGSDAGNEWIEIQNTGEREIDISDLKFLEQGISHNLTKFLDSNILKPLDFAVITNSTTSFLNNFPNFQGNLFLASFSLSNSGEEIALKIGDVVFGNITYSSSWGAQGNGESIQLIGNNWYASPPTPGKPNSLNKSNINTTTNISALNVKEKPASNIVISEIQVEGEDAGDEFIELYNPKDEEVNLSGWSIQYLSGNVNDFNEATIYKKNFEKDNSIKPHKFFLIARDLNEEGKDGYRGKILPDLTYRSFNLSGSKNGGAVFLVATTSFITSFEDENIVSSVFYGEGEILRNYNPAPLPSSFQSLQRKTFLNDKCFSTINENNFFLPKNCVTHPTQSLLEFDINQSSNPQNKQSLKEPRKKPTMPLPFYGKESIAFYDYQNTQVKFLWNASLDDENFSSGIIYKIFKLNENGNKDLLIATTSLEFNYNLEEIGRKYYFEIFAYDKDGMPSDPTEIFIDTTFQNKLPIIFSQGFLNKTSLGSFYGDNQYNLGRGFSGILKSLTLRGFINDANFYNTSIVLEEYEDKNYTRLINSYILSSDAPFDNFPKTIKLENLNIGFNPYSFYRLNTYQGYQNRSLILFGTDAFGEAISNSFVYGSGKVLNPYTFYPFLVMEGEEGQKVDLNILQKPTTPQILSLDFDKFNMNLKIVWSTSTDLDSVDDEITYEINYSTSSELLSFEWKNLEKEREYNIPLIFPNKYKIAIRALDTDGLYSEPKIIEWDFPINFRPYLVSNSYNEVLQEFTLNENIYLGSITVFTKDFSTMSRNWYTNECTLLLEDADTNSLVATSYNKFAGTDCNGALTFSFLDTLPYLLAQKKYRWKFSINVDWGNVRFYGINEDLVGGFFNKNDFKNALFKLEDNLGRKIIDF